MGRGFGKLGAEEAVTVASHDAAEATVAQPSRREIIPAGVAAKDLTDNPTSTAGSNSNMPSSCRTKKADTKKHAGAPRVFRKKAKGRYGFFGLDAGEVAAAELVAGFSVVVVGLSAVTGFLLRAVITSVVKSALSLE